MELTEEKKPSSPGDDLARKRKIWLVSMGLFVLIATVIVLLWWWIWGRFEESTTDAYVNGNQVVLNARINGITNGVYTDNTHYVEQGQLLVTLDPTDALIELGLSKAYLAETARRVVQMFLKVDELKAARTVREAELAKTSLDFERRERLVQEGGVSTEDFEHSEAALMMAYGELAVVEAELKSAIAQVRDTTALTHPILVEAKERLQHAWVGWTRTHIKAPASGVVAQRKVQVGTWVSPQEPLLAIIPMEQMWVDANFKEDQLRYMKIGQRVFMTADIYGGAQPYHGTVVGIGGGSGSVFSALPPQNATGNWIKIVQRVPVRVSLAIDELKVAPLRLGLSMEVRVDLHDQSGPRIPLPEKTQALYHTAIYENELEGLAPIIEGILQANIPPDFLHGK